MPKISVIIPTWNSAKMIHQCLGCLAQQTVRDFEIIIIDNASSDESVKKLKEKWSNLTLQLKKLEVNNGYAIANNIGARLAHGKWLALLNADAFPEPDWLEKLLKASEEHPEFSVFASRQIQANSPELLDGAGDAYHMTGLAWRQHYNQLVKEYGYQSGEVFSACPTAALYSREEFLKVGGFDEDYFSYFEDVDLGFRLRLSGAKCLYVPEAVVHHVGSASTGKRSDFSVYYGYRNMIWTFVKNMPVPLFWVFLPLHISAILFFAVYLTLRRQGRVIWFLMRF
jgi:GT2 family glycosyltransferase